MTRKNTFQNRLLYSLLIWCSCMSWVVAQPSTPVQAKGNWTGTVRENLQHGFFGQHPLKYAEDLSFTFKLEGENLWNLVRTLEQMPKPGQDSMYFRVHLAFSRKLSGRPGTALPVLTPIIEGASGKYKKSLKPDLLGTNHYYMDHVGDDFDILEYRTMLICEECQLPDRKICQDIEITATKAKSLIAGWKRQAPLNTMDDLFYSKIEGKDRRLILYTFDGKDTRDIVAKVRDDSILLLHLGYSPEEEGSEKFGFKVVLHLDKKSNIEEKNWEEKLAGKNKRQRSRILFDPSLTFDFAAPCPNYCDEKQAP